MIIKIINLAINTRPLLYLDPGSGSMLIQIVVAAVLGAGVAIRVFWKNIKAFFAGKKVSEVAEEDPTAVLEEEPTAPLMESTSTKE